MIGMCVDERFGKEIWDDAVKRVTFQASSFSDNSLFIMHSGENKDLYVSHCAGYAEQSNKRHQNHNSSVVL